MRLIVSIRPAIWTFRKCNYSKMEISQTCNRKLHTTQAMQMLYAHDTNLGATGVFERWGALGPGIYEWSMFFVGGGHVGFKPGVFGL